MKYCHFLLVLMAFLQAPASAAWGSGGSVGTLSGDTWTPGRDGNGIVNLASWNLVPTNRWIEIAGTRLDGLDAAVKAAVPGWSDIGNEDWNGVTDDWNGMAWDTRGDSERGWLAVSGRQASFSRGETGRAPYGSIRTTQFWEAESPRAFFTMKRAT